jgi:hypothetical protein
MKTFTDKEKEIFLKKIASEYYTQGDSYYAYKSKKGKWNFGYSNDYPLQHGKGDNTVLPDKMVDVIMSIK